jgi:hypothetical protein
MCRDIEQRLIRQGMAPFVGTAGIEILRIPGAGKLVQVLYELGGKRLKARLAILGPCCVQVQAMPGPVQMRQGEGARVIASY